MVATPSKSKPVVVFHQPHRPLRAHRSHLVASSNFRLHPQRPRPHLRFTLRHQETRLPVQGSHIHLSRHIFRYVSFPALSFLLEINTCCWLRVFDVVHLSRRCPPRLTRPCQMSPVTLFLFPNRLLQPKKLQPHCQSDRIIHSAVQPNFVISYPAGVHAQYVSVFAETQPIRAWPLFDHS